MTVSMVSDDLGQVLNDRFQLVRLLGTGAASRVYLAHDNKLARAVAIRILHEELASDSESVATFLRRMQRDSVVGHDNILWVYLSGEIESSENGGTPIPYLVTEFLGGGSLRTMLDSGGPLSLPQTVRLGIDAAKGLANAHQNGLIHYDIRPENLLFSDNPARNLRIKDFGLARALAETSLTEPVGLGPSTNLYSAPELFSGGQVDGKCDVYSLALVLAECILGTLPLTGSSTAETIRVRTRDDLALRAEFGPLQDILEAAGRVDPTKRPDAAAFARRLEEVASLLPEPLPLPIVPTLGEDYATTEIERPLITTTARPLGADAEQPRVDLTDRRDRRDPDHGEPESQGTPPTVLPDPPIESRAGAVSEGSGPMTPRPFAEPASDPEPRFAVAVDLTEQESLLAASRPQSFGPVAPYAQDSEDVTRQQLAPEPKQGPRRRWRLMGLVVALLVALGGGSAYWWFAVRIPQHPVPRLVGANLDSASKTLRGLNFVVDSSRRERRDGTSIGEVIGQTPTAGTKLGEGERVHLTVSLGQTLRSFPKLAGLTREDAIATIQATDLARGKETMINDEEIPAGVVVSAGVGDGGSAVDDKGQQIPRDTPIDLVISAGPAPRTVPNGLIGASAEQARAALQEVQLEANIIPAYDEKAPKGQIISSSARAGESLPRGSKVTLTMSKGPAPIAVPDVRGMTGSAAAAKLESVGFVVEGTDGSPSGMVLQTDPTPGELRQRGTAVRIFTKSN